MLYPQENKLCLKQEHRTNAETSALVLEPAVFILDNSLFLNSRPARWGLLRTLINTLELAGRRDEMYLLCHFAKEPCCCRPTTFRARCVNMKQLQSADINKGKGALCQPYRFLGAWDYFFLWLITADHFAQHTKSKNRRCAMSWCWGSVELTMLLSLT